MASPGPRSALSRRRLPRVRPLCELYTHHPSDIHRLDARVKVLLTLAFILSLSLTLDRAWPAYILFLAAILSVSLVARLSLGFVLRRSLLAIPFALAALPLVFAGPLPHQPVPALATHGIAYSPAGLARFASIAVRSWISVQAAIVLSATTPAPDLLLALQRLRVPKLLVAIVGLMWRYLFVIGDEVSRMLRARASRSAAAPDSRHTGGSVLWRARVTGGMAGNLLLRSVERSERVYAAMVSRGYNGELPAVESAALSRRDRGLLILGGLLLAFLWLLGLLTGG